jgi:hypothetical protein
VFAEPLARIFDDADHSQHERRGIIVGYSGGRRLGSCVSPSVRVRSGSSARERRRSASGKTMKKARKAAPADDRRAEYAFDYQKARPNRFTTRASDSVVAVVLEPDVAKVFTSAESVNRLLRSVISAIPSASGQTTTSRKRRKAG